MTAINFKIKLLNFTESEKKDKQTNFKYANEIVKQSFNLNEIQKQNLFELLKRNYKILNDNFDGRSILVNGEVQSGKTNNLISFIGEKCESDLYDLVIYFTGTLNDLKIQNSQRFYKIFSKFENYVVKNIKDPSKMIIPTINKNKTYIFNLIKRFDKYNKLLELIRDCGNIKVLLVNDEGDESTLTENFSSFTKEFLKLNNKNKLITITATPFKNLYHNESFYDKYVVLESSKEYCSFEKFKYLHIDEKNMYSKIKIVIEKWIERIKLNEGNQLLINTLNSKYGHESISNIINELIERYANSNNKNFEIYENIHLNDNVHIINGDNETDFNELNSLKEPTIIVGGIKLSRGITFENLTGQLLAQDNEDGKLSPGSLLQKARWCGYRKVDKTMIFFDTKTNEAFNELKKLQNFTLNYKIGNQYKIKFDEFNFQRLEIPKLKYS